MQKWCGRLSLTVVLAVAFSLPSTTHPAQAAVANGICEDGELCLWRDADFQGCLFDLPLDGARPAGWNPDDFRKARYKTCGNVSVNDSLTSYQLRGDYYVSFWEHPGTKGANYCVGPRAGGNVDPPINDKASSLRGGHRNDVHDDELKTCRVIDHD